MKKATKAELEQELRSVRNLLASARAEAKQAKDQTLDVARGLGIPWQELVGDPEGVGADLRRWAEAGRAAMDPEALMERLMDVEVTEDRHLYSLFCQIAGHIHDERENLVREERERLIRVCDQVLEALTSVCIPQRYLVAAGSFPPRDALLLHMVRSVLPARHRANPLLRLVPDDAATWATKETVRAKDVVDATGAAVFERRSGTGLLLFIDPQPEANWAHDCVYILQLEEEE